MLLLAAASAAVFGGIAYAVARRQTRVIDEAIRDAVLMGRSESLDLLSSIVTVATAPALLVALACTAAAVTARTRSARVWLPMAASPWIAMTAGASFTWLLPQQCSPDPNRAGEPSFPSGHTTGLTAEVLTFAVIARRHDMIGRGAYLLLATLPLVGGVNRIYRDRHWASDIAGSWSAGVALTALLCASR